MFDQLNYQHIKSAAGDRLILFLHGYMGSSADWQPYADLLQKENIESIILDLPGHGNSPIITPLDIEILSDQIVSCITPYQNKKLALVGYSMGGRIAMDIIIRYPQIFTSALIESASPGIEDQAERIARQQSDQKLLADISSQGDLTNFLLKWYANPIFGQLNQNQPLLDTLIESKNFSQVAGWQESLNCLGVGPQPSYWKDLSRVSLPISYISGREDIKYTAVGTRLAQGNSAIKHHIVDLSGHNTHLEQPKLFLHYLKGLWI
ncbi:MAG: 2-succinyl-6-hydroxy-2,4-cyclohexadiene-1-carboxylate synthase [Bdellovibrionales bacterium]|jgi:2-succinyl-6-hydroxy-2,4-cyclohexadiene-1-carboxylate synthase|nr:2-succinyl-6-hydroxy-2,4-cyclohexadiene-1-carboxylate synthase [Bdellovibrionales bacterium]MBT3527340.1 2-succinyl-6-hydroxy-2,4-cyclohexadiene-1-carboxylate synthase [Bdellovibrionales bacterium]MBT7668029.1 2-succinyl-6-hydroxy-2,4-cyclohexadiene-1-carboxylate synthase [Bdellovibrionales bacterium]